MDDLKERLLDWHFYNWLPWWQKKWRKVFIGVLVVIVSLTLGLTVAFISSAQEPTPPPPCDPTGYVPCDPPTPPAVAVPEMLEVVARLPETGGTLNWTAIFAVAGVVWMVLAFLAYCVVRSGNRDDATPGE